MNTVLKLEGPLPVRSIYNESDSFIERSRSQLHARSNDTKVFHIAQLVIEAGKDIRTNFRNSFSNQTLSEPSTKILYPYWNKPLERRILGTLASGSTLR